MLSKVFLPNTQLLFPHFRQEKQTNQSGILTGFHSVFGSNSDGMELSAEIATIDPKKIDVLSPDTSSSFLIENNDNNKKNISLLSMCEELTQTLENLLAEIESELPVKDRDEKKNPTSNNVQLQPSSDTLLTPVVLSSKASATAPLIANKPSSKNDVSGNHYWNWFADNHDPIFGMNYWTRFPQNGVSILNNCSQAFHIATLGLPAEAVIGFIGPISGGGGLVDTYVILKRDINTGAALWNGKKTRKEFLDSQLNLKTKLDELSTARKKEDAILAIKDAAKEARSARAAHHKLSEAEKHAAEHMTDGVRYTAVSWAVRTVFAVRLFFHTVTWLARASGILGVVAGAMQMISGLLKWRSAQKTSSFFKKSIKALDEVQKKMTEKVLQHIKNAENELLQAEKELNKVSLIDRKIDQKLQEPLIAHIREWREGVLHKAREKRLRAKCETAAGVGTLIFGAIGIGFPPVLLGALGVGLIYASFRIYKGVELYFSNKQQKQQKQTWRDEVNNIAPDTTNVEKLNLVETNPYYAVRYLVESIQEAQGNNSAGLEDFLQKLGIPKEDSKAVCLLAENAKNKTDISDACKALEDMFFSENWLS